MIEVTSYKSIITLNVNGVNSQIKRHSVWKNKKARPKYLLLTGDSFQLLGHTEAQIEKTEDNFPSKRKPKESVYTILMSDKIDSNQIWVTRDKEGYIMIKWSIHQDVPTVNIYAPNTQAPKC